MSNIIIIILFQSYNQNLFMSEYWYDIKSDDANFDDEPVYANSEEVRQSVVDQQKYWVSLMFFIMKSQKISPANIFDAYNELLLIFRFS